MYAVSFGKIVVAAAGTPVKMATILSNLGLPADLKVNKLHFKPFSANTGKSYIGLSDTAPTGKNNGATTGAVFSASTGQGLIEELAIKATSGPQDRVEVVLGNGQLNSVRVADYAVDVQVGGEAVEAWADVL